MFKLDLSPTFQAPVRFDLPAENGGQRQVVEFVATFPRMSEDELDAFTADVLAKKLNDRATAALLLKGWSADVCDAAGAPLPFNLANLATVLNVAGAGAAVCEAFRQAQPRAALGN